MRPSTIYGPALLLCTAVTAWPSYLEPAGLLERGRQYLQARQTTTTSYNLSYSAEQGEVTSTSTTASSASATTTATGSASAATSGSTTTGTSNTTTKATTTSYSVTTFSAGDGTGGISMLTPNPTSSSSYYKIKDYVTFGWNYTSCSILPTAIDILAVASGTNVGVQTFTLALNQSVSASTQAFTWDTGDYQSTATNQLLTASYTLVVYDADSAVSATAAAGYLGTSEQFYFAMYSPQASVAWTGFSCITCSGAVSSFDRQTMSMVFGVMAVTVLSFTWFTGAAGLF